MLALLNQFSQILLIAKLIYPPLLLNYWHEPVMYRGLFVLWIVWGLAKLPIVYSNDAGHVATQPFKLYLLIIIGWNIYTVFMLLLHDWIWIWVANEQNLLYALQDKIWSINVDDYNFCFTVFLIRQLGTTITTVYCLTCWICYPV